MLETATRSEYQAPARVLRLHRLLYRLRPVKLATVADTLARFWYECKAVILLNQFFPDEVSEIPPNTAWDDILATLLHRIEVADWFPVDWQSGKNAEIGPFRDHGGILDVLYDSWMQTGEDDYEHDLSAYLNGIPVRSYGFTEMDFEYHHGLYVLSGLVSDKVHLDARTLTELELYDNVDGVLKADLRRRLEEDDFSHYPEPLCWLPELAAIATGTTGNVLLDTKVEYPEWWPEQFLWDTDVGMLREAWAEARPVVEHLNNFVLWLQDDDDGDRARQMVLIILGEEND
jgi:hypothetical protein